MTSFTGFPAETFAFLRGLAADNSKAWFDAHRAEYDAHVLTPALDFVASLAPRIAPMGYQAAPRLNGSYRRLNRDVRFSKDKTPYSPRIHLIFWTGEHPLRSPAVHLVLHADSIGYGAGEWGWTPVRLARFREALSDAPARAALLNAIDSAARVGAALPEPELKRLPKTTPAGHPAAEFFRRKSLVVRTLDAPPHPASLGTEGFVDQAVQLLEALDPINRWLIDTLN